ncbi:Kae1-associated serine/threonine protein kinase [Candidatus Woesearchaeota archaeon]|nr:Kae1-associated serine/threonine protein kinase [Candidatus Woesearchaeota archaeon]
MSTILSIGAEATVMLDNNVVVKERTPKSYRIPALDEKLRKARTKREAKVLEQLAAMGFPAPKLIRADGATLTIEYITGARLRDFLTPKNCRTLCKRTGELITLLHEKKIMHGDLTTSNMMVKEKSLYFIDFGLSFVSHKIEDMAVDLHLLQQCLESTHASLYVQAWKAVIDGYSTSQQAKEVMDRLEKVILRGRNKAKW